MNTGIVYLTKAYKLWLILLNWSKIYASLWLALCFNA